jgi:hypothetical protein
MSALAGVQSRAHSRSSSQRGDRRRIGCSPPAPDGRVTEIHEKDGAARAGSCIAAHDEQGGVVRRRAMWRQAARGALCVCRRVRWSETGKRKGGESGAAVRGHGRRAAVGGEGSVLCGRPALRSVVGHG